MRAEPVAARTEEPTQALGRRHATPACPELGNRARIALASALAPSAVVAPASGPWERQADAAAGTRPQVAPVHRGPDVEAAARALRALAFTSHGHVFVSSAVAGLGAADRARVLGHEQAHAAEQPQTEHGATLVHRWSEDGAGHEPTAEEVRVGAHLQKVLDRLPPLSDGEVERLETAVGGSEVVRLVVRRRELLASVEREKRYQQSRGMGIMILAGAVDGRLQQIERLDESIAQRLDELGLPDERALFRLVSREIPDQVLARATKVALGMLDVNEETARRELRRYGEGVCTPDLAGLLQADRDLREHYAADQIDRVNEALERADETETDSILHGLGPGGLGELQVRQRRYEQLRLLLALQFPILLSPAYRPGRFADAAPDQLAGLVGGPIQEVLDNITHVREAVADDELKVWQIPHAVSAAMVELGIAENDVLVQAVQARIRAHESDEQFRALVKAALAIGTTVLAGVLFTPAVGALVGAAWGVESLVGNVRQYRTEAAAEGVSLDPVLADISMNDPTLVWIVVDVVALGLELGALTKALRPAARGLVANPGPATLSRLRDDALAAGASADDAERLAARAARRFGLTADDLVELTPQTRRVAVSRPDLLAAYEKLANERMAQAVRSVLRAQRSTPARRRLGALYVQFDRLRRSVGERALSEAERTQAMAILREARRLARKDFTTLRQGIWRQLRRDPDLRRLADEMVAAGDAKLGGPGGSLRVRTAWDDGRAGFQALEPDHVVRVSDNPWKYNDPDNLVLTDSSQNQQFLEALRREGGIWATDDVERFVVSHGLLDQAGVGPPGSR